MQHSAVPELDHARTRPMHWLATATALAAVIALSSVLEPDPATAVQPGPEASAAPVTAPAPDPAAVDFPIECGPVGTLVQQKASGDLDGDGRPETVAVVRCDAGSGNPPNGVYVLTQGTAAGPRVVATLVDPKERRGVTGFAVADGAVTATLLGYSSPDVPSCCPDITERAKWQWKGGAFVRSTPPEARGV
ncbi:hypothetical protein GCM10010145_29920 [Streptomyces ruber]|uniref:Secreted protein n=2 Tax=Streptomyces TaxID=1883 RepID=A0A918ERH0_9ACTN|nr:hypothetical protein [Streptomyces ruber]GGQ57975.1 hypothetical protein GCM10010145_29920 [Streptomyces ruber]